MKNNLTIMDRTYLAKLRRLGCSQSNIDAFEAQMRPLWLDVLRWLRFRLADLWRAMMRPVRNWRYEQWKRGR